MGITFLYLKVTSLPPPLDGIILHMNVLSYELFNFLLLNCGKKHIIMKCTLLTKF